MSGLRGRSAVAANHRSALPQIPGIPWWGAAIVASTFAAVGFAFDAGGGSKALGGVFAASYVLGCVLAVLAVRQSGVFTAVIQPPLILFIAVPTAYFVFHGSTFTGIKDTLINCGYPLIERFPLMFFTTATVLLIGLVRWYLGVVARRAVPTDAEPLVDAHETAKPAATSTSPRRSRRTTERSSRVAATAAASDAVAANAADVAEGAARPPRRSTRTAASATQRSPGAAAGTGSRSSRHGRPQDSEMLDPAQDRPRRRSGPPVDPPAEPRRRPRSTDPREAREPREPRFPREPRDPRERRPLPPLDRRGTHERPERSERPQRRERSDPFERPERSERPQRRPRVSSDYEPYEAPPSRPSGVSGTHHPVSRVRYRDAEDGESRTEHRSRPRPSRHSAPESWEYDV